jgi:hypothetical protein
VFLASLGGKLGIAVSTLHFKQFYRWLTNEGIDAKLYFLPFISTLLATLAQTTLFGSELNISLFLLPDCA